MNHVAQVIDVSKEFAGDYALRNVSLDLRRNEIVTLVGPNGAGKTTLTRIMATLLRPTTGQVIVDGFDALSDPVSARRALALVPQGVIPDPYMTPYEHVFHYLSARGTSKRVARERTRSILADLGLWERRDVRAQRLSGGFQRRTIMAMAMATQPRLLLLDEPTTGLDPAARRQTWDKLADLRSAASILLTTHDLVEAQTLSDRVAFLKAGTVAGVKTVPELLRSLPADEKFVIESDHVTSLDLVAYGSVTPVAGRQVLFPFDRQAAAALADILVRAGTPFSRRATDLEDCYFRLLADSDKSAATVQPTGRGAG